jgi:hypothetical protein
MQPMASVSTARPARMLGQAQLVGQPEELVLTRVAQVGIEQQGVLTQLREDHGQVGGDKAAPFPVPGADDGDGLAAGFLVKPAQAELAA